MDKISTNVTNLKYKERKNCSFSYSPNCRGLKGQDISNRNRGGGCIITVVTLFNMVNIGSYGLLLVDQLL